VSDARSTQVNEKKKQEVNPPLSNEDIQRESRGNNKKGESPVGMKAREYLGGTNAY